jgi:hypothetical protein
MICSITSVNAKVTVCRNAGDVPRTPHWRDQVCSRNAHTICMISNLTMMRGSSAEHLVNVKLLLIFYRFILLSTPFLLHSHITLLSINALKLYFYRYQNQLLCLPHSTRSTLPKATRFLERALLSQCLKAPNKMRTEGALKPPSAPIFQRLIEGGYGSLLSCTTFL